MKKLLILLVIAIFAFTACGKGGDSDGGGKTIKIRGSSTIEGLAKDMAKAFQEKTGINVIVRGGGSGRGIDAVLRNTDDIGNSSRNIKSKEIEKLKKEGVKVKRVKVGIDGICIIVNKGITGIKNLDISQVADIYFGKITNWKEIGGPDKKIVVYTRDKKSGTGGVFRKIVLSKKNEFDQAKVTTGNADLANKVSQDSQGIGYVGYGFAQKVKDQVTVLNISHKAKGVNDPVEPSEANIQTGKYPISRFVYQFVRAGKLEKSENVKKFIDFMISNPAITTKAGFVPIDKSTAIDDVW